MTGGKLALFSAALWAAFPADVSSQELRIRADKLVYLERGEVAEFSRNVVFEREDFRGNSRRLRLDKKTNKAFASGDVRGDVFSRERGDMNFFTEELFYEEASSGLFSPLKTRFEVDVSTTAEKDIYIIHCSSFTGSVPEKKFYLTGQPVTIEGEKLSGFSDRLYCSPAFTEMRGDAHIDYFEPAAPEGGPEAARSPWKASADYIQMDFDADEYEFKGNVKGLFYPHDAENR